MRSPLLLACLVSAFAAIGQAEEPERHWYKGNTHAHSLWSDGNDFPEMITDWYHSAGYHFLAISDHNVLSRGEKWMSIAAIKKRQKALGKTALQKLETRFGADWIVRRQQPDGTEEIRLRRIDEYRDRYEKAGEFLLIEAEEISAAFTVHVNAINLDEVIPPKKGENVVDTIRLNFQAVAEQEERLGRKILAHLNHPNFRWAVSAEQLAEAVEARYFEVYNGHPGINHLGDADHPGDERIWDLANTLRLTELKGPDVRPLFGLATDDSHTYHGGSISPGRGWIMVHATELSADGLISAMREGHFYASTGVVLEEVTFDPATRELRFRIQPVEGATFQTKIIGTRPADGEAGTGAVLASFGGETEIRYVMKEGELYARATITSSEAATNPSFRGMKKQAWTQPVGWKRKRPRLP